MSFKLTFSGDISEARRKKNWTQQQVADHISVDVRTYQNWENAKKVPNLAGFYKVVNLLGLNPNDYCELFEDEES